MKAAILTAVLILAVGCAASSDRVEDSPLVSEGSIVDGGAPVTPGSDRFMGSFADSWSDHLRDCWSGLSFTIESIADVSAKDAARWEQFFR